MTGSPPAGGGNRGGQPRGIASAVTIPTRSGGRAFAILKETGVTYVDLAKRLKKRGFSETETSITNKLKRGTLSATFFLRVWRRWSWRGWCWRRFEPVKRIQMYLHPLRK
jgi:hypothetical protein